MKGLRFEPDFRRKYQPFRNVGQSVWTHHLPVMLMWISHEGIWTYSATKVEPLFVSTALYKIAYTAY